MIKILLVDDNPTFLAAVIKYLAMLPDAQVVAQAHDGHEALAQATQCQPDLVLLDIMMPGMNGLEVATVMQSWPQPPQIVFLSMHDTAAYRLAAQELGVLGFVSKTNFVLDLLPLIARLVAAGGAQSTGEKA
ncbi:MAG: response regulator transcription factor [Gammaproteobacteria bacterium]|uniref:response regulator n=1 Tax=Rhodoferax sp. TaxID=50421 RepID=UPI0017BC6C19|nr:response regulator transcription factor [Rhodoferax sp.]MBU3898587.1 response regulator transcription factor [Gammaproteobacteria bacterium]MBA3057414.1 response regulator transcription factor [Rhodoferax sp.]MBU3997691.1 response regulator transcription factor [Gammaproteobacteria bacterium]MBU4019496.1 response regulator transcription factor [Gammaproteobacteria bacterium]MBU4079010.1 response regulator transcription factor [Gammaproteobacteria bacterium]